VGISTPKQEYWMRDHVAHLPGATLLGVGAAFDFHAGMVKRAPVVMRRLSLEWLHRLASEPRRLWRRYLIMAPKFVWHVMREKSSVTQ
jgi:N-acetylglucosaminyldiphosphoundecaprenol N-acetyl-beta-D-mannosaminyltransferase